MSRYRLNKLCYDLKTETNRVRFRGDEAAFVRGYDLDEHERAALHARDYAALFDLGVNIYVLVVISGLDGLRLPQLQERMRAQYAARDAGATSASVPR